MIALLLAGMLLSGCSLLNGSTDSTASANPNHLELTTIRVGGIAAVSSAALYIAQAKGYFAAEGLSVKITTTQGGAQAVPKLLAGGLDITLTNDVQAIDADIQYKGGLKFVADGITATPGSFPLNVLSSSSIASLHDLAGKTVSISSLNDIVTLALKNLLQANAIPLDSVHFVQVAFANSEQALRTGQVDAAVQAEPYATQSAVDLGARKAVDPFDDNGPNANMPIAAYVATSGFVSKYPRTVAAFQRAMTRAATDAASRAIEEQVLPGYTNIPKNVVALMVLPSFPISLDPKRLQRVVTLMGRFGQLSDPSFQVSSMITIQA